MTDIVKIFALGGLDENGKNMYVVEINNDIFVLEAGVKYPEKTMPGIDIIIPDYTYLVENKNRVRAYIISHGHDDYMGALGHLLQEVPAPVYASYVTSLMIQETLNKFKINVNIDFKIVETTSEIKIANRNFSFFSTTHSVAQSFGVAIDTSEGYIVYTGEYIIDSGAFHRFRTDLRSLAKISDKKILCLMSESNGALKPDFASPKHKVTPYIEKYFDEHKGRIIFSVYSQNLFTIQEIINLALSKNKKILVFSKGTQKFIKNLKVPGLLEIPIYAQANVVDLRKKDQSNLIVLVTGTGERLFRTLQRITNNEFVDDCNLYFSESDLIINTAQSNTGNEVISVKTLDELHRTGAKIINLTKKDVSKMHAQAEDLKMMISLLQPKYYFPVSGNYRQLLANATIATEMNIGLNHKNVLLYDNGMAATFANGRYKMTMLDAPIGEYMIDGLGVFDSGSVVINDRHKLSDDGVIILGISVDYQTKKIIAGPDIQTRGLVFVKEADHLLTEVAKMYERLVQETLANVNMNYAEKRQVIREHISRYIRKETGKDPMILSMIVEI